MYGREISSAVMFSESMVSLMILIFWERVIEFGSAGADMFAEVDDVIFIVEVFRVAKFFDADVVDSAKLTDAFWGAGEVGGAVFNL